MSEARLAAEYARIAALRLKLNPHFMFNTLNAGPIPVPHDVIDRILAAAARALSGQNMQP